MPRVLLIERQIMAYRIEFLRGLASALAAESIELDVAAAREDVGTAAAGQVTLPEMVTVVPNLTVTIRGRTLVYKRVSALAEKADLVIANQALKHLETYRLLARRRRTPVALWGHGARMARSASALERAVERRLTLSADWFFAYTPRGADHVAALGFPAERITVVNNTFDTTALAQAREGVTPEEIAALRTQLDLSDRHVCLFLGSLRAYKRLEFLLRAGSIIAEQLPDFRLVVAGDGPGRALVEDSLSTLPWLRYVGPVQQTEKARLGAVSDVMLMPGAVGLAAVDSFVLRTPIITTRSTFHGPEIDYLRDGIDALFADDDEDGYARVVIDCLSDRRALDGLQESCRRAADLYSMEHMIGNFVTGIKGALASRGRCLHASRG